MGTEIHHSTRRFLSGSRMPKGKQLSDGYFHRQQNHCTVRIHGDRPCYFGDVSVVDSLRQNHYRDL